MEVAAHNIKLRKFAGDARSDIRMLTPTMRDELLNDISKAVDRYGGELEMDYETHLYMARRTGLDQ